MRIKDFYSEDPQQALESLAELGQSRALQDSDRVYVVAEQAALLLQIERSDEARELLLGALDGRGEDYAPTLKLMLAQIYLTDADVESAMPLLESWFSQTEEPSYIGLNLLAYGYLQTEQYERAVPVIEGILTFTELVSDQWFELMAYAYMQSGRTEDAMAVLDEMIAINPDEVRWWRQLSSLFLLMEDYSSGAASMAISSLYEALSLEHARRLASLYSIIGMPADGARLFREALDRNPEESDYEDRMMLGEMLVLAREVDAAIEVFKQASDMVEHGEPALKIGQLHMQWERYEQAREALRMATRRNGEQSTEQLWYLLAIVEINLDNFSAAYDALERIDPDGSYGERAGNLEAFMQNQANRAEQ
jgi:pentatricopeptide repeat protein